MFTKILVFWIIKNKSFLSIVTISYHKNVTIGILTTKSITGELIMKSGDLEHYEKNPRIHGDGKGLSKSIFDLGDLSGVVYNVRLKCLVGGHYRTKVIPEDSIIEKIPVTDPTGTIAEGTIILPTGQRLSYREVDWDEKKHQLACIEANNQKIQGQWDVEPSKNLLEEVKLDLPEADFEDFGLYELFESFEHIDIDTKKDEGKVSSNYISFTIKCDTIEELEEIQTIFETKSKSISFQDFEDYIKSR